MKKTIVIIAIFVLSMIAFASCKSKQPPCPAYGSTTVEAPPTNELADIQ